MKQYDVLAIGELNADLVVTGLKSMPQAGKEITADQYSVTLGSSTAICASGLAKLGLRTGFIGKVGDDRLGRLVMENLKKNHVATESVVVDQSVPTGLTISLSSRKDRALVTYLGSIRELRMEDLDLSALDQTRHIHVGSFFLQQKLRGDIPKLFELAHKKHVTTSLDAGWDDTQNWDYGIWDALSCTDVFFPNETEALHITQTKRVEDAAVRLAETCGTAVVKLGPKGAVAGRKGKLVRQKTYESFQPVDTTGAGDSFNAGFLYACLAGKDLQTCLKYGNACGSISVTKYGGASSCASLEEAERLVAADLL